MAALLAFLPSLLAAAAPAASAAGAAGAGMTAAGLTPEIASGMGAIAPELGAAGLGGPAMGATAAGALGQMAPKGIASLLPSGLLSGIGAVGNKIQGIGDWADKNKFLSSMALGGLNQIGQQQQPQAAVAPRPQMPMQGGQPFVGAGARPFVQQPPSIQGGGQQGVGGMIQMLLQMMQGGGGGGF